MTAGETVTGFPEYVREDNEKGMEQLQRHPLLDVYEDELLAIAAYEAEKRAALERIRRNGRPNLTTEEERRLVNGVLH